MQYKNIVKPPTPYFLNILVDILYIDFKMALSQNVVVLPAGKYREMSVLQGEL